jgi:hypothetical protein
VGSVDEFSDKLSPLSKTSLDARNTYANGVLVWAKTGGDVRFARFRRAVFATEIARRARAWHDDVSDISCELASARVEGLLAAMATGIKGRKPDEDYQRFFGPDIPRIVEGAYSSLRASADRHSS